MRIPRINIPLSVVFASEEKAYAYIYWNHIRAKRARVMIWGGLRSDPSIENQLAGNPNFDDSSVWTLGSVTTISGGELVTNGTGAGNSAQQNVSVVLGNTYKTVLEVSAIAAGSVRVKTGSTLGTLRTSTGIFEENLVFATTDVFAVARPAGTHDWAVTRVELIEQTNMPNLGVAMRSFPSLDGSVYSDTPDIVNSNGFATPYTQIILNGAASIGDEIITVDDASLLKIGDALAIAPNAPGECLRTIVDINSNDVTLSERLYAAIPDTSEVYVLQSTSIYLERNGAMAHKIELENLNPAEFTLPVIIAALSISQDDIV